jgi:type I restriction enzyme S subunit
MSEWKKYKLKQVAEISTGFPFKGNKYTDQGTKVVRGENVTIGELRWDTVKFWNEHFDQFQKYSLQAGDIVIGMDGSRVGKNRAQIRKSDLPLLLAQRVACIRAKEGFSQDLIAYLIKSPEFEFYVSRVHTGTSIPHISQKQIEEFEVSLTDHLPTQKAIAEILSSLDDKIELNNQINQNLEALAQALFKQWFVDFEFPNEIGEPYKSSGGELVESELGEIPKGWEVKSLEEIAIEITRGFTSQYVEKSNLINLNQKVNRGNYLDKSNFKYYPEDAKVPNNKFAKQNDILINSLGQGTLGRIHLYKENTKNVVIDQHISILRSNGGKYYPELLYLMLINPFNQSRLEEMVTGSTGMLMLNISKIRDFKIVVPPIDTQEGLSEKVTSLFGFVTKNVIENQDLNILRNTLLPKLISGEIEVNQSLLEPTF